MKMDEEIKKGENLDSNMYSKKVSYLLNSIMD